MKRKKVLVLSAILVAIIVGGVVYNYVFNSKHRDIANEEATVTLSAKQLYSDFENDESQATTKYLDKVIEIQGKITAVEDTGLVLSDQIQVGFDANQMPKLVDGKSITVKGRCVGYDELLEMVKIDQATVINK
ncbi:hypothetical protein [uncultured Winogradskyella sp.]|uniref:OB-fold protein n=1 Tax=uncultured Winogradskyella sp. TaxID=395353 RepID=UPI002630D725|nr:hypothetical protein [uncultured Winogradskyella sp.]